MALARGDGWQSARSPEPAVQLARPKAFLLMGSRYEVAGHAVREAAAAAVAKKEAEARAKQEAERARKEREQREAEELRRRDLQRALKGRSASRDS